ncbi:MAG: hypothetical protein AABW50_04260 [Nanoarchaeota archaeon]
MSEHVSKEVFAIVRAPKNIGDHSNYIVTSPYYNQGQFKRDDSITVDRKKWLENFQPEEGVFVILLGVFGKPKGLRASSARFATPYEIQFHTAKSKEQD